MTSCGGGRGLFVGVWTRRFRGPRWGPWGVRQLVGSRAGCASAPAPGRPRWGHEPSVKEALMTPRSPGPGEGGRAEHTHSRAGPFPRPWLRDGSALQQAPTRSGRLWSLPSQTAWQSCSSPRVWAVFAHLRGARSSICCRAWWRHLPPPYPPVLPSDPSVASSKPSLCPRFIREDVVGTGGRKALHCVLLLGHSSPEGKHHPDVTVSEREHPYPLLCGGKTMGKMALAVLGGERRTLPAPEEAVASCMQAHEGTSALLWL